MGAEQTAAAAAADRRHQLLDRLADVIAESGIEGVSIRTLATRAEVSIGTVQYYFSTKDELLHRVWEYVRDEATQRFDAGAVATLPPRERLARLVELLVAPTSDDRLARVWLALVARAAHDDDIAALHRGQWQRTENLIARALVSANPARSGESGDAAAELLALADGLTLAVLTEPERMPPGRALRIARQWTERWVDTSGQPPTALTPSVSVHSGGVRDQPPGLDQDA
ncbi:TetR/AcrR family transcriptional regulator [Nocardia vermiculata]|uniref:TetR/AcrR family transcriptional regulator n=1 Tax=Nocardia vermiculata TaxID=257274 RepID=A0A846XP37_9NOCA|nr:TetR/AcrR family transcriptional regulator [Nocardia vermiculata]NKY48756.1 TetR/AcrR family transcriptional regulator [Nocardia vermiculata]